MTDTTATPRDALGRIVEKAETVNGTLTTHRYAYDVQGRLTEVRRNGALIEQYSYDPNSNRLSLTTPSGTLDGTYDDQDRLLTYGKWTYTYTPNGELHTKTDIETGAVTTYAYDALGNLLAVALPDGRLVEYAVDGRGRRVAKKVDGVVTNRWLYKDQLNPVAELDGDGNLVARYVYGSKPNVPEMVVRYDGGTMRTYRVVSDHLGSPRMAVNVADAADVPFSAEYTSFGEVTGSGLDWMAYGFAGGRYDADTGLVRFGVRDYDPAIGRWIGKDPIRFDGGSNLYGYVVEDPVNNTDRLGLAPDCDACRACLFAASVASARCIASAGDPRFQILCNVMRIGCLPVCLAASVNDPNCLIKPVIDKISPPVGPRPRPSDECQGAPSDDSEEGGFSRGRSGSIDFSGGGGISGYGGFTGGGTSSRY